MHFVLSKMLLSYQEKKVTYGPAPSKAEVHGSVLSPKDMVY